MADFVLLAANAYLVLAILAVIYRFYGISARAIARKAAHNALKRLTGSSGKSGELSGLRIAVAEIFSDNNVNEREFDRFAEVAIVSYIAEKDRTIRVLRKAVEEQDIEIRVLGYLLHRTLRDRAYLEWVVAKISADSHTSIVGDAMVKFFAQHRLQGFAIEFSHIVSTDFSAAPKRVGQFVDEALLAKIESRGLPTKES